MLKPFIYLEMVKKKVDNIFLSLKKRTPPSTKTPLDISCRLLTLEPQGGQGHGLIPAEDIKRCAKISTEMTDDVC